MTLSEHIIQLYDKVEHDDLYKLKVQMVETQLFEVMQHIDEDEVENEMQQQVGERHDVIDEVEDEVEVCLQQFDEQELHDNEIIEDEVQMCDDDEVEVEQDEQDEDEDGVLDIELVEHDELEYKVIYHEFLLGMLDEDEDDDNGLEHEEVVLIIMVEDDNEQIEPHEIDSHEYLFFAILLQPDTI